jgi:signal transduction histidine kinase
MGDVARRAGALVQAAGLLADLRASRERVIAAREEERRRLRSDLHDGVGPRLAGMALQLDSLTARLEQDPALAERARRLRDGLRETVAEVRRVVDDLRPPALDELGLAGALRESVAAYSLEPAGAAPAAAPRVDLLLDAPLPELPAAVEVAAYRIATEAVANAVRHSGCRTCRIRLGLADAGLAVEVADDGGGLPAGVVPHVGLVSMRERATEIGGRLTIDSGADGTRVRAWLPLPAGPGPGEGAA